MLYTLRRSPWQCDINALLRMLQTGDDLLLVQDGVFTAIKNSYYAKIMIENIDATVFALEEDIEARGLSDKIINQINIINYIGFINLVVKQPNHISWC